jgi:hypothetical protein
MRRVAADDEQNDQRRALLDDDNVPRTRTALLQLTLGHAGVSLADDEELQAVVIENCHPDDLAARAGLRPGDVILALNDEPVRNHSDTVHKIESATAKGDNLIVTYMPASQAAATKERAATDKKARRSTTRRFVLFNVVALLAIVGWLHVVTSRDRDASMEPKLPPGVKLLSIHDASQMLASELEKASSQAAWLAGNGSTLTHLEKAHPGAIVQMLQYAMGLNQLLNATRLDQANDLELAKKAKASGTSQPSGAS